MGVGAFLLTALLLAKLIFPTATRVKRPQDGFSINIGKNIGLGDTSFAPAVGRGDLVKVAKKLATHCVSRGCFTVVYNTRMRLGVSRQN